MDNAASNRHFKVNFILKYMTVLISLKKCDALRDLGPFVPFKKHKNTHGRVILLLKLQAKSVHFY